MHTRNSGIKCLQKNDLYWHGPKFLLKNRENWPVKKVIDIKEECKNEYYAECTTNLVKSVDSKNDRCFLENVIKTENLNSLKKLYQVTCYLLHFVRNLLAKLRSDKEKIIKGVISFDEMSEAKYLWLSSEQKKVLKSPKFSQLKKSLCLFRDENCLLRLKGCLGNAESSEDFKHLVFIHSDTYFTKLLIRDCHIHVLHSGLDSMLNYLRNTYWICQGRKVVKQVIKDCVVCKKAQAWPLRGPEPPDLPSYRLSNDYAFSNTGIDFAGPLYVKNIYGDSGLLFKFYICLFTCATTRNVHLELTPSMSAQHLISCLKRFAGRRGKIDLFISDNFQTFVSDELKNFLSSKDINWKYILPPSPWRRGFYEHLVRIAKSTL